MDWRVTLFSRVIDWIQEHDKEYIPIIAHDDREDDLEAAYVWQLSEVIDLQHATLPQIYYIDPMTHKSYPYPETLDNIELVSPELLIAWADLISNETDLERTKRELEEVEDVNYMKLGEHGSEDHLDEGEVKSYK